MEENTSKKKKDYYLELALFLILGFLLGVVIKTEASKRVTVGFNDNQISSKAQYYDINKIQEDLLKENESQDTDEAQESDVSTISGGSCGS